MPSDIEIAQQAKMMRIADVARDKLGISDEHLEPYGHYKAKVSLPYLETLKNRPNGKLILVTAINPTSYETVDTRIHRFYERYPNGRILTAIESIDWERGWVLFKTIVS